MKTFFDDGRGGAFIYGVVTSAGPKVYSVTWESGIRQRFRQDRARVDVVVDEGDRALALEVLSRSKPLKRD